MSLPVQIRQTGGDRRYARVLLVALCAVVAAHVARADTAGADASDRQKIFEKAFGRAASGGEQLVSLPIVVDGYGLGEVQAVVPGDLSRVRIRTDGLIAALQNLLEPSFFNSVRQRLTGTYTTLDELRAAGIGADIDEKTLAIALGVPPEMRKVHAIRLRGGTPPLGPKGAVPTADFSSILNIHTGIDYLHASGIPANEGRQPVNAAFESATNIRNFVLQGDFNYSENGVRRFQRGDVSLVRDDAAHAVRYELGDLSYPVTGFQSFLPLGGLTVARNFSLQPYRVVQPSGEQQFSLTSDSRVDMLINGRLMSSFRLAPGRYNFSDFPLAQGSNDVQFRITDNVGRVTTISAPVFFSPNLLAAGTSEFSYSLGLASRQSDGLRRYPTALPAVSLFHRVGLTNALTAGVNYQGAATQQMPGMQAAWATPVGIFQADLAGSRVAGAGVDVAARLLYTFSDIRIGQTRSGLRSGGNTINGSITYTGPRFAPLGVTHPANPTALNFQLAYTRILPYDVVAGIGGSYQVSRTTTKDGNAVNLSLRIPYGPSWNAGVQLTRSSGGFTGGTDYRALFTLTYRFSDFRQFLTSSYDTAQRAANINYQYVSGYGQGAPSGNVTLQRTRDNDGVTGQLMLNTARAEMTLGHDETLPRGPAAEGSLERRSSFTFGTALLFADGVAAVSRPVPDSFALFVPNKTLEGQRIGLDRSGTNYAVETDGLGPLVVPDLISYQTRSVFLSAPDLPLGLELGQDLYQFQPSYRSGTLVRFGGDATVLLDGVMADTEHRPLPLQAGIATAVEGGTEKEFFTNRSGRFRIEGLKPGQYDLALQVAPDTKVRIDVPENARGLYRIGEIDLSLARDKLQIP